MTEFSPHVVVPLLVWGSLVGLDLVSVPQAMISRPLVAGTVAGWLASSRLAATPPAVVNSPPA